MIASIIFYLFILFLVTAPIYMAFTLKKHNIRTMDQFSKFYFGDYE